MGSALGGGKGGAGVSGEKGGAGVRGVMGREARQGEGQAEEVGNREGEGGYQDGK